MHNFELDEDQQMIADTVRKLVQDDIAPNALDFDEHSKFNEPALAALAEAGMCGLALSEEAGGVGMGFVPFAAVLEEVAKGCGSTARLLHVHAGIAGRALDGVPAAKSVCQQIAAFDGLTAWIGPDAGIEARPDGDGFKLDGTSPMVTGATEAARFVVAAVDPDGAPMLFVLPTEHVTVEAVTALGFRAAAPGKATLIEVRADAAACVAQGEDARAALERAELAANIGAGALAVGFAAASVDASVRHAHERIAFGKPLYHQQAVAHKLVESRRRAEGGRHLVWHAARQVDLGAPFAECRATACMAKLNSVEAAVFAADEGIQVHGGYGYVVEYHVERHYRDAKTLEVLDHDANSLRDGLAGLMAVG